MPSSAGGPTRPGAGPPEFVHRTGDHLPEIAEIEALGKPLGRSGLTVRIEQVRFRLGGLDAGLLDSAREVFEGFTDAGAPGLGGAGAGREVHVDFRLAGRDTFLAFRTTPEPERYRILVTRHGDAYRFVSYHFACVYRPAERAARVALALGPGRREERLIDNVFRVLAGYAFIEEERVLVHAAALARGGRGYVFLGPSGAGKTTVAKLSLASAVPTTLLSDDQGLLSVRADRVLLSGTPFRGGERIHADRHPGAIPGPNAAVTVPLAGLYRLVQSDRVAVEDAPRALQIADLLSAVPIFAGDPYNNERLMTTLDAVVARVPLRRLHFRNDDSFWKAIGG